MDKSTLKNSLKICVKGLLITVQFLLRILIAMLNSPKRKKPTPTQHEIMCGEKLPFTNEYFVPDEKHK